MSIDLFHGIEGLTDAFHTDRDPGRAHLAAHLAEANKRLYRLAEIDFRWWYR
jgi:hypothetical protein